jgi:hypothetical protein
MSEALNKQSRFIFLQLCEVPNNGICTVQYNTVQHSIYYLFCNYLSVLITFLIIEPAFKIYMKKYVFTINDFFAPI